MANRIPYSVLLPLNPEQRNADGSFASSDAPLRDALATPRFTESPHSSGYATGRDTPATPRPEALKPGDT